MQETTVLRGRGTKEALLKDTTITLLWYGHHVILFLKERDVIFFVRDQRKRAWNIQACTIQKKKKIKQTKPKNIDLQLFTCSTPCELLDLYFVI